MLEIVITSETSINFYETTLRNTAEHSLIALIMEAVNTSETSVIFDETTRRSVPDDSSVLQFH
jgi:hypothetical protein